MDYLNEALAAAAAGNLEKLHALQRHFADCNAFYAFYEQIFARPPQTTTERVLVASLLVPYLQDLEHAYNFAEQHYAEIYTAFGNCIRLDCPEFARVLVMSLARRQSLIVQIVYFVLQYKKNSAYSEILRELATFVGRFPEKYAYLIDQIVSGKDQNQIKCLLQHRKLSFAQISAICQQLDASAADFDTIELLCCYYMPQIGIKKVSQFIYDELARGNLVASALLVRLVKACTVPAFLLSQDERFYYFLANACDYVFTCEESIQLNIVEWLFEIYGYCAVIYKCNASEATFMSTIERLEQHVYQLVNGFFGATFIAKSEPLRNLFGVLVQIYCLIYKIGADRILNDVLAYLNAAALSKRMIYIYTCLNVESYDFAEPQLDYLFNYLMEQLDLAGDDFELVATCMGIVQQVGEFAEKRKIRIRLQQRHIGTFLSTLQKTLTCMSALGDVYYEVNVGSRIYHTILGYFNTNDVEMYSSFEIPEFSATDRMIPELLIYFNVLRMSNFYYLHILFSQQRLSQFCDSADLLTLPEFAEFSQFISHKIDYISPQRLSQQCIGKLYSILGHFIEAVLDQQIDFQVAGLINALFVDHFSFAAQFFQSQDFVDYILQSALSRRVSMDLFKHLVEVNPAFMKKYAFALAKQLIFADSGDSGDFTVQDAVDILRHYCWNKDEVVQSIFGGFCGIGADVNSFYTDTDNTDGCDLVECGVFDIRETIQRTLAQIYE